MSNKHKTLRLVLILSVLIAVLVAIKVKENKQGDRSFKSEVVKIDTSLVSEVHITPKGETKALLFSNTNGVWIVSVNNKPVQAEAGTIEELLTQLVSLKPKRVASTKKDQWEKYELTDSLATKIMVKSNKKVLAELMIGKFTFDQNTRQMTSYVRNVDEKEVYAIDGYMSMMYNRPSKSYRSNSVLAGDPESWNKLVYFYPADSSFSLIKQNNTWLLNGIVADSVKIDKYFSQIRMLNDDNFYDEPSFDINSNAIFSVRIEGDSFKPITVKAIEVPEGLVCVSSQNSGNHFLSDKVQNVLFVNKDRFLTE